MSLQVSYKKQFLLWIMLLLVLLLIIEGIARAYEFITPGCRFLGKDAFKNIDQSLERQICYDLNSLRYEEPSIRLVNPEQYYPTVNINSYGFRGPEITKEKAEDIYRIFVVGGSTTFGFGATSDDTTIPGFLQEKFEDTDVQVEVINAGVAGANSFKEAYYIKNMLLEFEPDLFIVYDGANDVRYRILEPKLKDDASNFDIRISKYRDFPFYRTPFVLQNLLPKDLIFSLKFPPVTDEITSKVTALWKSRMFEICELGKKEGFLTIIALQPMVGAGNKTLTPDERTHGIKENTVGEMKILENMAQSLDELNTKCDRTMDLRGVFDQVSEPVYFDQLHTTDFGNEIIAQKLFELSLPFVKDHN